MAVGCVIGVDLGGTKLLAGVVDVELNVHHRAHRSSRGNDSTEVLDVLREAIEEARDAAADEVLAVGLGIPSLMDEKTGVARSTVHLPLQNIPVADLVAERIGLPVAIDNDANLAMLAEHRFGAARGCDHAVMFTLGTGIGSGVVVDGKLLRGSTGAAAELGHMVIDEDGPPCGDGCPNNGCLESMASGSALASEALRVAGDAPESALGRALEAGHEITGALVTELAHDGDAAARDVISLIGSRLGVGIANAVNIFNPEVVVIGGGVIAAGDMLLEPARQVVARRALSPSKDVVRIVPARFGTESGMLGAAILARDMIGR
jgi:glucokinase